MLQCFKCRQALCHVHAVCLSVCCCVCWAVLLCLTDCVSTASGAALYLVHISNAFDRSHHKQRQCITRFMSAVYTRNNLYTVLRAQSLQTKRSHGIYTVCHYIIYTSLFTKDRSINRKGKIYIQTKIYNKQKRKQKYTDRVNKGLPLAEVRQILTKLFIINFPRH